MVPARNSYMMNGSFGATGVPSIRHDEQTSANYLAYLFLFLYLVAKPFYLFKSGLPQIADLFAIALFFAILLAKSRLSENNMILCIVCFVFSLYALFVGGFHYLYLGDTRTGKAGIFYIYNTLMLFSVLNLGNDRTKFFKLLLTFVVVSCVIQVILSFTMDSPSKRETLYFNNPNQFAYWGLLSATIYFVCAKSIRVRVMLQIVAWPMFCYLVVLGLSKAAMIAFVVLTIIHFSRSFKHMGLLIVISGLIFIIVEGTEIAENVTTRIANIGEQADDDILGRGYDRILEYPQYLFFGAGEYGLERFVGAEHEIHSTFGTIIFSYGFIGTLIFGIFLWFLFRQAGLPNMIYLLPIFTYGGVHNGIRFTLLWLLFGLVAIAGNVKQQE